MKLQVARKQQSLDTEAVTTRDGDIELIAYIPKDWNAKWKKGVLFATPNGETGDTFELPFVARNIE